MTAHRLPRNVLPCARVRTRPGRGRFAAADDEPSFAFHAALAARWATARWDAPRGRPDNRASGCAATSTCASPSARATGAGPAWSPAAHPHRHPPVLLSPFPRPRRAGTSSPPSTTSSPAPLPARA
ncbi:DUF6207 family protein [Streptomyces olivaceus]|uniref:DUF6207 family protein n=1 Tax=Streptomyces olivaceus TaxID=47716 RepID=UPI003570AB1B